MASQETQRPAPARFDPSRCPLCGQANACAMEAERSTGQPQPPCWCTQMDFSAELLARVPSEAQRAACICARCAQTGQDHPADRR